MEEYEIDLRELLSKLWNGKYFIFGVFILAVLLASLYSFVYLDPVYESRATLRIDPIPGEINGTRITSLSLSGYSSFFISQVTLNPLQEKIYRDLGREISSRSLNNRLEIELDPEDNFLSLAFQDNDPQEARAILSAWIDTYNEQLMSYILTQNEENHEQKKATMERATRNFDEANQRLIAFQEEFKPEQMEDRLNWLDRNLSRYLDELQQVKVELEALRKTSPLLEELVAGEEENVEEVIRSLDQQLQENYFQNLRHLVLHLEDVSPIWVFLRQQSLEQMVRLEELEKRKTDLENLTEDMQQEKDRIKVSLLEVRGQKIDLERRHSRAEENLTRSMQEYDNLSFFMDNLSCCGITIMEEPYIREGRVGPNHRLNLALAGVLGIFLGTGGLLFYHFMQGEEKKKGK